MEPFLVEFVVREWSEDLQVKHEGEEFLFLLEGELELHYGGQVMTMGPGDSVYYDSNEPHGYIVTGETRPRAVAVLYSRSGDSRGLTFQSFSNLEKTSEKTSLPHRTSVNTAEKWIIFPLRLCV